MNWLRNMKIFQKLMLSFLLMSVLVGFVGYQGISGIGKAKENIDNLYNRANLRGEAHQGG